MTTTLSPAPPTTDGPAASPGAGLVTATLTVAGRTVRQFARTPQLVVVSTVQGAMFLLIFRYVFGGAIQAGGLDYVDFLVPGFLVSSILFTGAGTAAGVAEDTETGVYDRLRSLPIPRVAIVAGRSLADAGLLVWGLGITAALGYAVGFRTGGEAVDVIVAYALIVLFGVAFGWLFITLGLVAGSAQAAQGMALLVFPFTFVSSAYVPVDSMPGWMQAFADHQPVTAMTNAVRSLMHGGPQAVGLDHTTGHWVVLALVWSAALLAVFVPLASWRSATR
ncbi:ABC transporter permease [Iamia sp. SCSIO 61187]|uniref:ABC transporter permease n=1 Tax=Iamia sp. SCSIO 61187 TaxID=2722752 RepID=UPI001C6264B0|nr:ABC transporter permease [Iamia sp. SCSIO 61187]QYG94106.1 ABC transporter permease [Iamia sp. SCSIO 61187]